VDEKRRGIEGSPFAAVEKVSGNGAARIVVRNLRVSEWNTASSRRAAMPTMRGWFIADNVMRGQQPGRARKSARGIQLTGEAMWLLQSPSRIR
jgi:hypothetical protein